MEEDKQIAKKEIAEDVKKQLAEKYGYTKEQINDMVSIHPNLSLRDLFKEQKVVYVEIVQDKGKQPIPIENCTFDVDPELIEKIVDEETKEEKEVVYKPVFVLRMLNGENKGNLFNRIPSGSEMMGLLKVEYDRLSNGMSFEGAFLKIKETSFKDKDKVEREGYEITQVMKKVIEEHNKIVAPDNVPSPQTTE